MADCSAAISISHAYASGNDEHRSSPSFSASGGGSPNSDTPNMQTSTLDPHQVPPENNTKKRRAGRPQGSKNKPKPPSLTTRDGGSSPVKTVILEIPPGSDVIERIISFACRNHVGVGILSATGSVSSVSLYRNPPQPPCVATGPFELPSLIGSFFADNRNPSSSNGTPDRSSLPCSFSVTLEGQNFQLFGGRIDGKLTAATQVVVVAAILATPSFDNSQDPRRQKTRACDVNGATGSFPSSTGMTVGVYGATNPAPPPSNFQYSYLPMHWCLGSSQEMN